jgi:hypothetical protein
MNRLEVDLVFSDTLQKLSHRKIKSPSEFASSFSDLLILQPHPLDLLTARSCSLVILAASFIGLEPPSEIALLEKISKIVSKRNTQGSWSKVNEALKLRFVPYIQLEFFLQDRTLEDFYGNDFKSLERVLKRFKASNPYLKKHQKVLKPHRKRGFDDKGHLGSNLPLELRPTRPDYPKTEPLREPDKTWLPPEYKDKNNQFQEGVLQRDAVKAVKSFSRLDDEQLRILESSDESYLSEHPEKFEDVRNKAKLLLRP